MTYICSLFNFNHLFFNMNKYLRSPAKKTLNKKKVVSSSEEPIDNEYRME